MRRSYLAMAVVLSGCASGARHLRIADEARRLQQTGDQANAHRMFAEALCKEEVSLDNARAVVETWVALGKPGRADQRLERCALPVHVRGYLEGLAAAAEEQWEVAGADLMRAEATAPDDAARAEIAYRLGLVSLEQGHIDDAIVVLQRSAGLAPLRPDVRLGLAQAQARARLFAECADTLRGVVAIPMRATDLERGRRILRNAVRAAEDPLPDSMRVELAELLTISERGVIDEQHLARVRELMTEQRHASVLMVAGVLAMRAGDHAMATVWLNEATILAPLDADPPRALGIAFFAADRPSLAVGPLRDAARRDPFDLQVRGMLAAAASKVGESDVALEAYRALTVLAPAEPDNFLWVARLERKSGRNEAARAATERGLAVQSDNVLLLVERAAISAQMTLAEREPDARRAAAEQTREAVDRLLTVAPGHPGADAIKKSVDGI
ncbi:MAG: tetratricopeptide repeat protein [Myxococcota bacterium]